MTNPRVGLADDLRDCLSELLGLGAPEVPNDSQPLRFFIGPVECVGRRVAEPCAHLERLVRPGLLRPLVHRGGLRGVILSGGTISIGDEISSRVDR